MAVSSSTGATTAAPSLESAVTAAFPIMIDALGISALGLLLPTSLSLGLRFGGQLVLLVALALLLTWRLLPLTTHSWFGESTHRAWSPQSQVAATGLAAIFIVTGVVGLVTLASSAALRLQPSTQFLQLLSALDIAWAVSTLMVAAYWWRGRVAAAAAGGLVGVACVWAIARYLDAVGFTPQGRWRLVGPALWEYVLPYDIAIALVAVGAFVLSVRRQASSDRARQ